MRKMAYNCIQWFIHRQKKSAVRAAHKQWGHGRLAPHRLSFSQRLSLCRAHQPFNQRLMEDVYHEILRVCAKPIEKSPWMWLPLNVVEHIDEHLQQSDYSSKKISAMRSCAKWMSLANNLPKTATGYA